MNIAIRNIEKELEERLDELRREDKLLEAQRLEQRTNYDIEMSVKGILLRNRKLLPSPFSASTGKHTLYSFRFLSR